MTDNQFILQQYVENALSNVGQKEFRENIADWNAGYCSGRLVPDDCEEKLISANLLRVKSLLLLDDISHKIICLLSHYEIHNPINDFINHLKNTLDVSDINIISYLTGLSHYRNRSADLNIRNKFGSRLNSRDKQAIPCTGAGHIKQMALCFIYNV